MIEHTADRSNNKLYSPEPKLLTQLDILDTPAEQEYDDIVKLASVICGVPISLITFLEPNRQFHKAKVGFDLSEIPLEQSFCQHACAAGLEPMSVHDATKDPRFSNNPLVVKDGVKFYTGIPLVGTDPDQPIGALCVLDQVEKTLSEEQLSGLKALARQAERLLKARHENRLQAEKIARLEGLNEELTEFTGIVAHDLKSPLGNINLLAELLQNAEGIDNVPNANRYLEMMKASLFEQSAMIKGLLEVRRQAGYLDLHASTFHADSIINEILDTFPLQRHRVALHGFEDKKIHTRKEALKQVLFNLISNAIKYSPLRSEIHIRFSKKRTDFSYAISNEGEHIPEKHLNSIFGVFKTLNRTDNKGQKGTGLGLAIVKQIVNGMAGTIHVESLVDGKTTFTVELTEDVIQ